MMRRLLLAAAMAATAVGALAAAAQNPEREATQALALAKRQAEEATVRSQRLEQESERATSEAARARADAAALAARIEAAEADITAAETRVAIVERLRARQRARLAERQEPVVRLTAALQTMGRRPPALALVQPGSLHDLVHVRALLASTLPVIRQRTAALREEVEAGNKLRADADRAVAALVDSRERLRQRRIDLARFEAEQRRRSERLAASALVESDKALAFGEEAHELSARVDRLEFQTRLRAKLARLPGPLVRPVANAPEANGAAEAADTPRYLIPVEGRLVTGMGEISDAGVHARGLTFEVEPNVAVVAPASGRVLYAGRFRGYGEVVIIDHGNGWTSAITGLQSLQVREGDRVRRGGRIGRTDAERSRVTVELRRDGAPFPITPLLNRG